MRTPWSSVEVVGDGLAVPCIDGIERACISFDAAASTPSLVAVAERLVDLDEVVWTEPPEREEAGSPNVVGAVALAAAVGEFERLGWDTIVEHERQIAGHLRRVLAGLPGVRVLGPGPWRRHVAGHQFYGRWRPPCPG